MTGLVESMEEGDAPRARVHASPPTVRRRRVVRWLIVSIAAIAVLVLAQFAIFGGSSVTVTPDTLPGAELRAAATKRERERKTSSNRFAYMLYVTQDIYGCSALHLMDSLVHKVQMDSSRIDLVVLHSSGVSTRIREKMQAAVSVPVRFIHVDSIHSDDLASPYWLESLTKLNVFREWGYDRVVYLDADGVVTKNLDHLFDLPPLPLYAPLAYWFGQSYLTSVMLVVEPSDVLFDKIMAWARDKGPDARFDMDILNMYIRDTDSFKMLPAEYAVLATHVGGKPDAASVLGTTIEELVTKRAKYIHYSCRFDGSFCKPWDKKSRNNFSELKGRGEDPFFVGLYEAFYKTEREKC